VYFTYFIFDTYLAQQKDVEPFYLLWRQCWWVLNELSSAKCLVFNLQRAWMSLKIGEIIVWVSNSLDPDVTPMSSGPKLFVHDISLVIGGVNPFNNYRFKVLFHHLYSTREKGLDEGHFCIFQNHNIP